MIGYYILIGLIYTLINTFIRKLDTDGDWTLPFVWIFIWPVCFIGLILEQLDKKYGKK